MEKIARDNLKVCFFDSGIGGLTLLCECVKVLPGAQYFYFADNFNVPYGSLGGDALFDKADYFFRQISKLNPAAAVVACNTVTARCIKFLREKYDFPIIGIQPAVKPAARAGTCAVLSTPSTANSEALKALIDKYGEGRTIVAPCPDLAAYIEENIFNLDVESIKNILPKVKAEGIVLGCTHYSFIKRQIAEFYSDSKIYDGELGTAQRLKAVFQRLNVGFSEKIDPNSHSVPNFNVNVEFVGGDEVKNNRVFDLLFNGNV